MDRKLAAMSQLYQQLQDSLRELERIKKIKEHTRNLQDRLDGELESLAIMEKTLEKEQRDVETLEKEGLTTMFRKFIGDREEKLEKERKEYLIASLRYNELYKSVELIRYELEILFKKEQDQEIVERRIEVQMKMREDELMKMETETADILRAMHTQGDRLQKYAVEVEEAFTAGSRAYELVKRAENLLLDAQRFGQRDIWGGRSFGSGNMKHHAIDQARELANQARHELIRFGNEVKDVFKDFALQANLDIESLGRFGDIFFDNIISDWLAQQKINKSLVNISSTRQQLEYIMNLLAQEKGTVLSKLEQLDKQRKDMIIKAKE